MTGSGQEAEITARTDAYFNRTKSIVQRFGDIDVTYAVFLRRPVVSAPRLMLDWLAQVAAGRGVTFGIEVLHKEGSWAGAGEPLVYITGRFATLVDLETKKKKKLARPASPRTTRTRCAWQCPPSRSSPWMQGIARAPTCRN